MPKNLDGEDVTLDPPDQEELLLEKLIFGDSEGFENNLKKVDNLYDYSSDEADGNSGKFFNSSSEEESDEELGGVQDEDLFFIDDGADNMDIDKEGSDASDQEESEASDSDADNAWNDSDDDNFSISLVNSDRLKKLRRSYTDSKISGKSYITRLRSQFEKIYPRPEWVDKLEEDIEKGSDDEEDPSALVKANDVNSILKILNTSQQFIMPTQMRLLAPNKIAITRLKDANHQRVSKSAIQSISFHRSHPLLLTGGFDKTLRIYNIDGKNNTYVTSLHLKDSPISACQFSPISTDRIGNETNFIFAAGRRRYMNKWDLSSGDVEKISRMYGHEDTQRSFEYFKISPQGNYIGMTGSSGWCNLLNGITGQWIRGFKIEGTIVDFEFAHDESFIIIINSAGEVWEYELGSPAGARGSKTLNQIITRWQDDGGIGITKIALGGANDRWLAIGTNNGYVNIYDRSSPSKKPFKTVDNLVTSISSLKFCPDGQVLCIASRAKRDALRLVHMPTGTVFSNWPTSGTPLGKVTAVAFSPNNELLAIGNEAGKVTLWRLDHY
ncbi:U3 snoRNA associated protein [Suhomyces tanzawaensis NRRL Y-17324]|uniref:U3 snoRNA associated protein n=1 Tax=Suhomyces tanzawaensis NRRL Y-17324 TaxID=984487 RepID=A0A1E4SRD8_9ASCO|nr:U3 snoRNA associated protein [Suhomyces tanzawaensis NRRL Y-17324]ODV82065.1 U3 snoRNA associated protein [Suhomyces tanzawaensis NRRL Y-17324]